MNAAARRAQKASKRSLSILIADDDRDTVDTLATLLAGEGHAVHKVIDARTVLEAVRRYKPQICILDIEMPGESGYAIGRAIIEEFGDARPWLIALSGKWTAQSDQLLARSIGFDHFLKKPADPQQLLALLQELPHEPPAA
jgi:DNA-binding response OmpR family regulator